MLVDYHVLIEAASRARQHAYAPYSNYLVGAAIVTDRQLLFTGCNIENASFSATLCAERVALASAVAQGHRTFSAMALVTQDGRPPCGLCLQVLYEFNANLSLWLVNSHGDIAQTSLDKLLPQGFDLKK